jgi:hypothetical protein
MGSAHDDTLYYEQEARRRAEVNTMTTIREQLREFLSDDFGCGHSCTAPSWRGECACRESADKIIALLEPKSPVSVPSKDDIAWTIFNTAADHGADFSWTVARAIAGKVLKLFPGG